MAVKVCSYSRAVAELEGFQAVMAAGREPCNVLRFIKRLELPGGNVGIVTECAPLPSGQNLKP